MATDAELSRNELIQRVRDLATKLGTDSLTRATFLRESRLTERRILKHFDSWNELVLEAGLSPYVQNRPIPDDDLLSAMRDAFVTAGGITTQRRFGKHCRYSVGVYAAKFGAWHDQLIRFRAWAEAHDPTFLYLADLPQGNARRSSPASEGDLATSPPPSHAWTPDPSRQRYGPVLNFRGLQHAPIEEAGVVFLFGMVSSELGYVVEAVQAGFPDCDAKRAVKGAPRYARTRPNRIRVPES